VFEFRFRPRLDRIAAVHAAREALERFLRGLEFARGDGQQTVDRYVQTFFQTELLLELVAAQPKRRPGAR
jgi:hypothetical protein